MAKAKAAKPSPSKPAKTAAKPVGKALPKASNGGKGYTKGQLINHLIARVAADGLGALSRKQVTAVLGHLGTTALEFAKTKNGGLIIGLGKVKIRTLPATPARKGRNPATGEEITIKAKPKRSKLVFRFTKDAKSSI